MSLSDLNHQYPVNVFQEADLIRRQTKDIWPILNRDLPGMDIIILVVDRVDTAFETLARNRGVLGYIREYWAGFFPLLLVDLGDPQIGLDEKTLARLKALFSTVHR